MSKIETLRKTPQKTIGAVKKLRSRHAFLPLAGVGATMMIWGAADSLRATSPLSTFPKYTTTDGRNSLAENLFDAGKKLRGISSTTETKLGKNTNGEPVIIYERKFSSSNWKRAQEIIKEAAGDLQDQPAIIEALKKIDMEIINGGSGATQDVFVQQIDEINAVIPQIASLKDSPQAQKRTIVGQEVRKRQERSSGIFVAGIWAFICSLAAFEILNNKAKHRKIEASKA